MCFSPFEFAAELFLSVFITAQMGQSTSGLSQQSSLSEPFTSVGKLHKEHVILRLDSVGCTHITIYLLYFRPH